MKLRSFQNKALQQILERYNSKGDSALVGSTGNAFVCAESPFVFLHNGWYYLFRTQEANVWPHKCFVYASKNPSPPRLQRGVSCF
jgi:beta-xylosidase